MPDASIWALDKMATYTLLHVILSIVGLSLSVYALYVEHHASDNPLYKVLQQYRYTRHRFWIFFFFGGEIERNTTALDCTVCELFPRIGYLFIHVDASSSPHRLHVISLRRSVAPKF